MRDESLTEVDGVSSADPLTGNGSVLLAAEVAVGGAVGGVAKLKSVATSVGSTPYRQEPFNTESYAHRRDNPFQIVTQAPLSTFSIDVDTASYANVRRFLNQGQLPPPDAVRVEELINYFRYDDLAPEGGDPFAIATEVASCPWNEEHQLLRIGLAATPVEFVERKRGNYVFLIDVSGSMAEPTKLPLVKTSLKMLARQLTAQDTLSIVVYAGAAGLVLPATAASDLAAIDGAIEQLDAGGSTAGGEGIQLAYRVARENFVAHGINRVILATDGDFNVGISSEGELVRLIEEKAKSGVFLTVLGFGGGNLQDSKMEQLADRGNGQYAYIDSEIEAQRALVEQAGGTLITLAKDVKIQVEFNPARVQSYRLIGYENRLLAAEDFRDDTKDAGEIGAGHTITALYELVPVGAQPLERPVDPLKYQREQRAPGEAGGAWASELATVKLRFKKPDGDTSTERAVVVHDADRSWQRASANLRLAAAVASFGMALRESPERGTATLTMARTIAEGVARESRDLRRNEFVQLVDRALELAAPKISGGR